jgi:hypothetical protein
MRRRLLLWLGLLAALALLVRCVDILTREPPPPPITASVPAYGPWAGGPPIFWGHSVVTLVNRSSEPVFIEAFSIAGASQLERAEERHRHLGIEGLGFLGLLPVLAGSVTVHVRVHLEKSQRTLDADLPAQVEAGFWCEMVVTIEPEALVGTPCVPGRRLGGYSLDD